MSRHLGLDLGGSSIKAVVLERDGDSYRELTTFVVETRTHEPPAGIVAQLSEVGAAVGADAGASRRSGSRCRARSTSRPASPTS